MMIELIEVANREDQKRSTIQRKARNEVVASGEEVEEEEEEEEEDQVASAESLGCEININSKN